MSEGPGERPVKTISAEEFELNCLEMIDLVAENGFTYVITKDGKPIAIFARPPNAIRILACISYSTVMPNRNLSSDELKLANDLLGEIRERLIRLAGGDPLLLFAFRRKIAKELGYDERGKPMARRQLKAQKWAQQHMKCARCNEAMPLGYSELDRKFAPDGYTPENTDLVHAKCHQARQAAKRYT